MLALIISPSRAAIRLGSSGAVGICRKQQSNFARCSTGSRKSASSQSITPASSQGWRRRWMNRQQSCIFSSSSFQPSEPSPAFTGQPIFPDIDLTQQHHLSTMTSVARIRNEDSDAVFIVTGASRGIGFHIVKALLERTRGQVVACCRSPNDTNSQLYRHLLSPSSLERHDRNRLTICRLDLEDQLTINQLANQIKTDFNSRVDVLWNVAGLLGDGGVSTQGPERSVTKLDRSFTEQSFAVNTIGPMMLCEAFIPMMKQQRLVSSSSSSSRDTSIVSAAVVSTQVPRLVINLSARVGSISDNNLGGWYSYRCSKSALNQFTRTLAHETTKQHNIWAVSLHPGTTDTDLSVPFQKNVKPGKLFPVDFTANRLLDIVESLEKKHSGGLYDWSGTSLPF